MHLAISPTVTRLGHEAQHFGVQDVLDLVDAGFEVARVSSSRTSTARCATMGPLS